MTLLLSRRHYNYLSSPLPLLLYTPFAEHHYPPIPSTYLPLISGRKLNYSRKILTMGIPDVAHLPGGPLSAIQPNPLKRAAKDALQEKFPSLTDGAEDNCRVHLRARKSGEVEEEEEEEVVKKPARKRKRAKDGDEEVRGRV